jgi:hypothetical protein
MTNELTPSRRAAIDAILERNRQVMATGGSGRLVFALDATMSRQATWDAAIELQAGMFAETAKIGGLQVQLVFFRGNECRSSEWTTNAQVLAAKMRKISCVGGVTQWGRVLEHVRQEHKRKPISAMIIVGDCCEEPPGALHDIAAGLGAPIFAFLEGSDQKAEQVFRRLSELTRGFYAKFDAGSASQLAGLLRATAVYAAGGLRALERRRDLESIKLLEHLKR